MKDLQYDVSTFTPLVNYAVAALMGGLMCGAVWRVLFRIRQQRM